jgi:hypothetical protein
MRTSILVLFLSIFSSNLFAAEWLTLKTCYESESTTLSMGNDTFKIDIAYVDESGAPVEKELLKGSIRHSSFLEKDSLSWLTEMYNGWGVLEGDLQAGTSFVINGTVMLYIATNAQDDTHAILVSLVSEDGPWYFGSTKMCNK